MGSCISKCKPRKRSREEDPCRRRNVDHDDKLVVISKDPPPVAPEITIMPSGRPRSPAPSVSSFAYSANNKYATASSISSTSSSLSSSSSSSYASSVSKDRSFSNDFLWSCAKENPHVIGLQADSKKVAFHNKIHSQNPTAAPSPPKKTQTAVHEKTSVANAAPTPKKRARASSPTLVRQKSFRKEQNFVPPTRGLRSPSPSRRFNGESNRVFPVKESYYSKPRPLSRGVNTVSSAPRRESFRAPTPSRKRELIAGGEYSERRNEDELPQHVSSKIDGKGIDDVVMEDINNPLIALDCFIFL